VDGSSIIVHKQIQPRHKGPLVDDPRTGRSAPGPEWSYTDCSGCGSLRGGPLFGGEEVQGTWGSLRQTSQRKTAKPKARSCVLRLIRA
jgi:hypothetical protein